MLYWYLSIDKMDIYNTIYILIYQFINFAA